MSNLKLDFLNLESLLPEYFLSALKNIPHQLCNMFEFQISSYGDAANLTDEVHLLLCDTPVAKIKIAKEHRVLIKVLEASIQEQYDELLKDSEKLKNTIIAEDIEKTLNSSSAFNVQMQHLLRFVRAHLMVEECGVFGIEDGFTIEAITQLGHPNKDFPDKWKQEYSAAVAAAVSTRNEYLSLNISTDKHFKQREEERVLKNFFCIPLLKNDAVLGAIYFANKSVTSWSEDDKSIAQRFARSAATTLEKHFFQARVQALAKTSDHLGKYLSKKVVKNVKKTEKVEIGGVEKKVVCLFADIRSFTTITEGIPASTLVKLLNFHFEQMSPIIDKYEGTLDKIVGDLIMAVWNIPHDQPEPELLAMQCAIEMQKEMKRVVAAEWQRHGVKTVGMGVGLNAGLAVAGNLGSSRFMNYTVVGDTINTAQRLESRAAIGEIWMAESMFAAVDGKIEKYARKENYIKLKGKDETVSAYIYHPLSY